MWTSLLVNGIPFASDRWTNHRYKCPTKGLFTHSDTIPVSVTVSSKFNIMSIVTGSLTGRMGDRAILTVKLPVTISTMVNFDGGGVGMVKQTLRIVQPIIKLLVHAIVRVELIAGVKRPQGYAMSRKLVEHWPKPGITDHHYSLEQILPSQTISKCYWRAEMRTI